MPITNKTGDILTSNAEVIVIPVNCKGVMGAGLAKAAKAKWPEESQEYMAECAVRRMYPGKCFVSLPLVFAATKQHWRNPSQLDWVSKVLRELGIAAREPYFNSIALPRLGCGCGGLDWADVGPLVHKHLGGLDCNVEVWTYE